MQYLHRVKVAVHTAAIHNATIGMLDHLNVTSRKQWKRRQLARWPALDIRIGVAVQH
jgi:hypothetical protein